MPHHLFFDKDIHTLLEIYCFLFIQTGENPAAMHHGRGIPTSSFAPLVALSSSNILLNIVLSILHFAVIR